LSINPTVCLLSEPAEERLAHYRAITLNGLRAALPDREPNDYLHGPFETHVSRMGNGLRPA